MCKSTTCERLSLYIEHSWPFWLTSLFSWHFRASDNREEMSSSSSRLLDHQHIKKRRKDRTRLRSPSVTIMSTSARTRPLHSFQKRKLYRMSNACYWNQQVELSPLRLEDKIQDSSWQCLHVLVWYNSILCAAVLIVQVQSASVQYIWQEFSCVSKSSQLRSWM